MNALALLSHTVLPIAGPRFLLGITERATTLSGGGLRFFGMCFVDCITDSADKHKSPESTGYHVGKYAEP